MAQRVFLHVGAPKTGTTYLQDRLARNRSSLARQGIKYPIGYRDTMFLAAVDLTEIKWPGFHDRAQGEWKALIRRVKASRGTVVLSHEVFAVATPDQIARVRADLAGTELHIVFTARDPARQLAADWQEGLKTYNARSFRADLERHQAGDPMTSTTWFWRAQHLPRSLATWAEGMDPARVHLITVPEGSPDALWRRFCATVGIDPEWAPVEAEATNHSLGVLGAQALRKINAVMLADGISTVEHRDMVYNIVVPRLAEAQERIIPITTPPDLDPWVAGIAEQWIRWAEQAGIDVVGDLEELRPAPRTGPWADPDELRPKRVVRLMAHALAAVAAEGASRPSAAQRLPARIKRGTARLNNRWRRR